MDSTTETKRRKYKRRSDEERIAELQARIEELKAKQSAREKKDDPILREIPKVQKRLRKFAQLAVDHDRPDIANSVMAFNAGLERILQSEMKAAAAALPPIEDLDDDGLS